MKNEEESGSRLTWTYGNIKSSNLSVPTKKCKWAIADQLAYSCCC